MIMTWLDMVDFIKLHMPQFRDIDEVDIMDILRKHNQYGTLDWVCDEDKILYVMRYNIMNKGKRADILDLCIDESKRNKGLIKYIIAKNWKRWPSLETFRFKRLGKYPIRGAKEYTLKKYFKLQEVNHGE